MDQTRLKEDPEYAAQREELRRAEIELMRQRERVASLRRQLPPGSVVDDYVFQEGRRRLEDGDGQQTSVRLSELFTGPGRSLVVYHLMYGKAQTSPCPMCTLWIDGFNGIAHHLAPNVDFAVVAAADVSALRAYARDRGWDRLRLLSCAGNTFKYDLGSEDGDGNQDSTVSVFTRVRVASRATPTPHIRRWRMTSANAVSISSTPSGTCSTSPRRGEGIGTPNSTTERDRQRQTGRSPLPSPRRRPPAGRVRSRDGSPAPESEKV